jgi:hypothetical protein
MTEALYVALDATCFEQGFLDYPRVLPDEAIEYAAEQARRARHWSIEHPVEHYMRDEVSPPVDGGRRLQGADGGGLVLAHAMARCAEAHWRARYPRSLMNVFNGACFSRGFSPAGDPGWQQLRETLFRRQADLAWPWWLQELHKNGSYDFGLTSPAARDALLGALGESGVVERALSDMRAGEDAAYADDLASLVDFLTSESTRDRWIMAWVAST